jgi:hypothetical protein
VAHPRVVWPDGKRFAFTIFDDPDAQTVASGRPVYDLLTDLGFRTTKAVWPVRGTGTPSDRGETCDEEDYRKWVEHLQIRGFEIGLHNATSHTSTREETRRGLEAFVRLFGDAPIALANHYNCDEGIYFGDARVSGLPRAIYNAVTRGRNRARFHGHRPGHPLFWGDLCRERVKYVRNFVFRDIDTLAACPWMPYHDPARPFVNYWFASSEGDKGPAFMDRISERHQERLEDEGGACVMYTHFAHGFLDARGHLEPRFVRLMERLAARDG